MWHKSYSVITDVPRSQLWNTIADVAHWSSWDEEIESIQIGAPPQAGVEFFLKPKGAPRVKLSIVEFTPPQRFIDVTYFPLAQMQTTHEFTDTEAGTKIDITITVSGILGVVWRQLVAQKQFDGLPSQTQQFIDLARKL